MRHLIQIFLILISVQGYTQDKLPIYEKVKFVKEYEMNLNKNKVFISSPFAKSTLKFPKEAAFSGKKVKKVTYLYSNNNKNPEFAQSELSDARYNNLLNQLEGTDFKDAQWETHAQIGCGNIPCSRKLYHGFVVEFEGEKPFIGHENLKVQKQIIRTDRGNTIRGAHGTKVQIPANAFVNVKGNKITGEVQIQLQEALTPEDIVLGNLETLTDDGQILQSGGMIKLEVYQGDNPVYLREGKMVAVEMFTKFEPGYSFYEGGSQDGKLVWSNPEIIDGQRLNPQNNNNDSVIQPVKEQNESFNWLFPNEVNYTNRQLTDVTLNRDNRPIKLTREMAKNEDLVKYGFNRAQSDEIKRWFEIDSVFVAGIPNLIFANVEGQGWAVDETGNMPDQKGLNNHQVDVDLHNTFQMKKLGWANVDCLVKGEKIRLNVAQERVDSLEYFDLSLIIPSRNIFIPGYEKKDGRYAFTHGDFEDKVIMPVGEKAYLIAIGEKDGETYFQMKEFTIGEVEVEELSLMKMKREEALNIIKTTL